MNHAIRVPGIPKTPIPQKSAKVVLVDQVGREFDARTARAKAEGIDFANRARQAAEAGDYARARNDFQKAYQSYDEIAYQNDMVAMEALSHLQIAIELWGKAQTDEAYTEFIKAETLIKTALRPDIAQKIERYRGELFKAMSDDLATDVQGAREAARKIPSECLPVNGEFVCG